MRADRARHARNNKSLTHGRQERRLGLTRSHRLIVPLGQARILSTGAVSRACLHRPSGNRAGRSLAEEQLRWTRKHVRVRARRKTRRNNKKTREIFVLILLLRSAFLWEHTIHFPNFLQLAHKNKTLILKTTLQKLRSS